MDAATPLLRPHPAPAPAPTQRTALRIFAALHLLRGALIATAPLSGFTSLTLPQRTTTTYLLCALVGERDVVLALLLATGGREALAVALVSDAADSVMLILVAAAAGARHAPLVEIGVVAAMAILEHLVLWSLSAGHEAVPTRVVRDEDKKVRLDMWLADIRRVEEVA